VPWKEILVVEQRQAFIEAWLRKDESFNALCERFGVSRKAGYKWVERFRQGGIANLVDRSRAPRSRPQTTPEPVAEAIVRLRQKRCFWGPRKLRAWLASKDPDTQWPAASTIGDLLKARGLVEPVRRRPRVPCSTQPLAAATAPNVVWSADFKGCFRVAGRVCNPLTITDNFSRMLLRLERVDTLREEHVAPVFDAAFEEYGLPWRIRTDNGAPFATRSPGGLSKLSVKWVKLGIIPERIEPGKPQQNGRHERMHRTLKLETASPPRPSMELQQHAFEHFRAVYNEERPHEALGQKTPASMYGRSPRVQPSELPDPEYPDDFELRRVHHNGTIGWHRHQPSLGVVLADQVVGLEPIRDGVWQVWFGPIYLGLFRELSKGRSEFIKNMTA
jgi:putative transposase